MAIDTQSAVSQPVQSNFPHQRLTLHQSDASRTPLVLIACGSFSPITYLHLRMFEMASDYYKFNNKNFEIMGGYLSPVGDGYKKAGLAPAVHRLRMCELAVESAGWLMVDPWEATNPEYIPTAQVLDHFEHEINVVLGGIERPDGTRVPAKICLLAGADLVQTMSTPGVWSSDDLDHILGMYGACIIEREGTDIDDALSSLQNYKDNIHVVKQLIQNNVSSTKIRLFLRKELSIRYLIPSPVINYIEEHNLYQEDGISSMKEKGNAEATQNSGRTSPAIGSSGSRNHIDKAS